MLKNTFQVFPQFTGPDYVDDSSQIIGCHDQTKVGFGSVDILFGDDVIKCPLPFNCSKGVLNNGLPAFVKFLAVLNPFFVVFNVVVKLAASDLLSVCCRFCALRTYRAAFALRSGIVPETVSQLSGIVLCMMPVAVSSQGVSLQAGVGICLLTCPASRGSGKRQLLFLLS